MSYPEIPDISRLSVDTRGAEIVDDVTEDKDSRGIYLPFHTESVSHIALDIGGSLAKCVYFSRTSRRRSSTASSKSTKSTNRNSPPPLQPPPSPKPNGTLTPNILKPISNDACTPVSPLYSSGGSYFDVQSSSHSDSAKIRPGFGSHGRSKSKHIPGGQLNFVKFETEHIEECIDFLRNLIDQSANVNDVSLDQMRASIKIVMTGGGAHKLGDVFEDQLKTAVAKEEEMECLITGLQFITTIPKEVFWYSDELVYSVSHKKQKKTILPQEELPRPSPNPPQFSVSFDKPTEFEYPCLLVNIGSGVSIIKVNSDGSFERVSGTSLGGGTLWGLLSLLTPATSFDEMLALSETGDNNSVDMLVGDIYGSDYGKIGLKATTIASSFGKVFKKGDNNRKKEFKPEDISKSMLFMISNNIGHIAYMQAEKHNVDRIYFGGCFIRGHAATISTLSYAIRFWSKDNHGGSAIRSPSPPPAAPPKYESYTYKGRELKIRLESFHPLWAHYLWNASRVFCNYLINNNLCKGKSVCELGAGAGLPSLVSALEGADKTVVTDYPDEPLLNNLRINVGECLEENAQNKIKVEGFVWGSDIANLLAANNGNKFDILILSDLVFNHSQHNSLLKSCKGLIAQGGQCLVFFSHHRPHKAKEDMGFFDKAAEEGWIVERVVEERVGVMFEEDTGDEGVRATVHGFKLAL
ncbi:hypothetical protein E3P81_00355 [Wallemia ichthyophaga]|nr:hypothetical protein E3P97_00357 [Wallemia ichthyophaga]TIB05753.1 hypothetical protein E3P96_00950 [Wallemia ichthyophaga]TIB35560.1 hypothetical protein E3P85_00357 [Wallemia ichthyophaga]TIB50607.1 hypothetical protein E3P82_00357 [Wallemia ichthyophaga]TIB54196.1 hypothetical protein E3P81_00355 [Wallemia ichthyophaga]